jgi:hypothetical protein
MIRRGIILFATFIFLSVHGDAGAQTVLTQEEAGKAVTIRDLNATTSSITGVVVNNTPHLIRDVEVLVEYHWLWANEFKPGPVSPGHSAVVKLDKDIPAGQTGAFRYTPDPPLATRKDGQYDPEVRIAGFTTVIPGTVPR